MSIPLPAAFETRLSLHRLVYHPGNRTLVVSFDNGESTREGDFDTRPAWGEKFYRAEGYSLLGVLAKEVNRYRDRDLIDHLEGLRDSGFFARFDHVVMIGGSMGGYGACAFAPLAPGCTVIAFSPVATLDPKVVPWEKRFPAPWKQDWTLPYSDAVKGVGAAGRFYLFYDNLLGPDLRHARMFPSGPSVQRLILPAGGHGVAPAIQQIGIMKEITRAMIKGDLPPAAYRTLARKRREGVRYWHMLITYAIRRKRYNLAMRLCRKGRARFPTTSFQNLRLKIQEAARADISPRSIAKKSPMKKTLYLHLGVHRTATTNIQATLFNNRANLVEMGYLYPLGVERHIALANNIFAGKRDAAEAAHDLLARSEAQTGPIHSLVLSDEDISMRRDLSPLKGLTEVFDVKVVMAMRRQDLWLESWWAQNVKGQWDPKMAHKTWPDFIRDRADFHWINYEAYIAHIESVFGEGSVLPYVFEKAQMPQGPVAAFCEVIGIPDISHFRPAGGKNISLTPEMSEFVRYLPYLNASMPYRLALIEVAEEVDRAVRAQGGNAYLLSHDLRAEIMAGHADANQRIAERFFGREDLFLEPLPDRSLEVRDPHLPASPEEIMQRLVAPYVQALINRFDKPK